MKFLSNQIQMVVMRTYWMDDELDDASMVQMGDDEQHMVLDTHFLVASQALDKQEAVLDDGQLFFF